MSNTPNLGCKEMLLWRLTYAVLCSVVSQALFLLIFLFIMNFNIIHPIIWMQLTFSTAASFSTWLYLIPLGTIIFAQGVICSKDYVYESTFKSTRFYKMLNLLSLRNLFLITLHVMTGGLIVWLYLSLLGGKYGVLYDICGKNNCLIEETFFMLLNGMWIGFFYFIKSSLNSDYLMFPVIQQGKLLMIKATIFSKLNQAASESIWPTFYFIIIYYYKGIEIRDWFMFHFDLTLEKDLIVLDLVNSPLLLYSWLFSTLFIFTILCMRLFFEVFLTEQWQFPIESEFTHILTLKEGLSMKTFPIIQHLACLDFYNLSVWDVGRRQQLFTLSQPGGHPHNWNGMLEQVLQLIMEFSTELNKTTDSILSPEVKKVEDVIKNPVKKPLFDSPYSPIRNMALPKEPAVEIVEVTYNKYLSDLKIFAKTHTIDKVKNYWGALKRRHLIRYFFGEVPESRISFILSKGQPVVWAIQGLSNLTIASLTEDRYGVVQKDLPVIVTSLITLKQNLDKLNKVSFVNRKSVQEQSQIQLKTSLRTAVRRSLYNISNSFSDYLGQIPLSKEVYQQMLTFVCYKEG